MAPSTLASTCAAPIKGTVVRLIKLDSCGLPVTGANADVAVFDAFTEIANSPQYEDGQRFLLKKANGSACVNQKDRSFLNWVLTTVNVCSADPRVLTMATSARLLTATTTGTGVMYDGDLLDSNYSMEVWQEVAGAGACGPTGLQQYFYWLYMYNSDAKIQDFSQTLDTTVLSWQAQTYAVTDGTKWLTQANAVVTGALTAGATPGTYLGSNTPVTGEHFGYNISSTVPPTAYCGVIHGV